MDSNHLSGDLGEQAVNEIVYNTYLKYWCYPNPKDEQGSKKEICDLLILFKSTAIIVSIKNYSFKGDYERYFRSTLDKALLQIEGAERKLFSNNKDVYIKHPDMEQQVFNSKQFSRIHRVIINLNSVPLFYPPGRVSKNGYVHIFNWNSFLKSVLELDTIPDFINYLKVREELFFDKDGLLLLGNESDWDENTSTEFSKYMSNVKNSWPKKRFLMLSGNELDLLSDYYFNEKKFNQDFYSDEYTTFYYQLDGMWDKYLSQKEVQRKKEDDRLSYFVDEFVKNEVLYRSDTYNLEIATELMSLSRFERRVVGKQFIDFANAYRHTNGYFTARRYGKVNDLVIGFLLHSSEFEHEQVIKLLEIATTGYCYWDKYQTSKIIMVSCSKELISFKYGYIKDVIPLPEDEELDLIHDLNVLNWFKKIAEIKFDIKEYPDQ